MKVFQRGFFSLIKGLVITAATGAIVFFGCAMFLKGLLVLLLPGAVTLALLGITLFGENIRIEVEGERLRYLQNGRLKGDFFLPDCQTRYQIHSETSFPPTHDITLYIRQGENEQDIDCSPLGLGKFRTLYAMIEQVCPAPVAKLETRYKGV